MPTQDNQPLIEALARLAQATSDGLEAPMRAVLEAILASELITGDDDGEPSIVDGDSGQAVLALFTTKLDLHFFAAGSASRAILGADAVRQVSAGEFDGLVINPGASQFELSREDVRDYFDVDEP